MAKTYPFLEEIRVKRMVVSNESLELVAKAFKDLKVLVLDSCQGFTTHGLAAIAAHCRSSIYDATGGAGSTSSFAGNRRLKERKKVSSRLLGWSSSKSSWFPRSRMTSTGNQTNNNELLNEATVQEIDLTAGEVRTTNETIESPRGSKHAVNDQTQNDGDDVVDGIRVTSSDLGRIFNMLEKQQKSIADLQNEGKSGAAKADEIDAMRINGQYNSNEGGPGGNEAHGIMKYL
ncbi:hypothetical protein K7X08_028635 [Anisodus acutangulus]|uniref:Uncharacterized protein n=1 Tax=Anisodus acutangulus TaxID=402998 RepID=A0A9Q1LX60_9SOLA|nr:hypothetical protein K7X08_028635 [Anisodus acutangulus]